MNLTFAPQGWEDYQYWGKQDKQVHQRINTLIEDTMRNPYSGLGQPEKLKYLPGYWSRRITEEHRLVYTVRSDQLSISQARYHYGN